MEHEATVPFPPDAVRRVLADPGRLGRCVPGLQVDAGDADAGDRGDRGGERRPDTVSGRMRVRVGGSTITYRGVLRLSAAADGTGVRAEAEGGEARGTGTVRAEMTVRTEAAGGGATILRLSGRAETTGRLAQAGPKAAESAGRRLLDRFASALTEELTASDETAGAEAGGTEPGGDEEPGVAVAVAGGAEAEGVPEPREAPETSGESGPSGVPGSSGAPGAGGASGTPGDARPDAPGASGAPDAGETEEAPDTGAPADASATPAEPVGPGPSATPDAAGEPGPSGEPSGAGGPCVPGGSDASPAAGRPEPADAAPVADGPTEAEIPVDPEASGPRTGPDESARTPGSPDRSADRPSADRPSGDRRAGDVPPAGLPPVSGEPLNSPVSPAAGRRTMIGRSAEEVDHAPPRGRYAPAPVPGPGRAGEVLRWAGPAAAVVITSAVVVSRFLRRRR